MTEETMDRHGTSESGFSGGSGGGSGSYDVEGMYEDWFLEYASYVILDRAVPNIDDGLKPVQRRILFALEELEDGRYNKAANVIGHTMRYHPHGDMAIEDALVKLGQKDLLIDTQGNWGNALTGDRAAAPRYIEARLTKFAKEVVFNDKLTDWELSYDGRNPEPQRLPVKFPLLLALGVEGIAVGLSTRILPHNCLELIDASIECLRGHDFEIYPDFHCGGSIDVSQYKDGKRGGKIRCRAKVDIEDEKTLKVTEIPYGTTTSSLIDSIVSANDKGKIKIRSVEDNTSSDVEILIRLASGVSPHVTRDALYAFTDCEVSISTNCCVIAGEKPAFVSVKDVLKHTAELTRSLLQKELEIERGELLEKLHFASLEMIFIDHKIYRKIEGAATWEDVLTTIEAGLKPYAKDFVREVTTEDIVKLTDIKIKKISKFDRDKANEARAKLQEQLQEVERHLKQINRFAIQYFKKLKKDYGASWQRKTQIASFEQVEAKAVAVANLKLFVNRKDGFMGTSLKKDEFICECSALDEVIAFRKDGHFTVTKVAEKTFVGKSLIHVGLFERGDEKTIYHLLYQDIKSAAVYAKRFHIKSITRDREYDLTKGGKAKILHFSVRPNGEGEVVEVGFKDKSQGYLHVDFSELPVQARTVKGTLIAKEAVKSVEVIESEAPIEQATELWFDKEQRRLNTESSGLYLGEFAGDDKICVLYRDGSLEITGYALETYFDKNIVHLTKMKPDMVVSCVYFHGEKRDYYVKRFSISEIQAGKREEFIPADSGTKILIISFNQDPIVDVSYLKGKRGEQGQESVHLADFVSVRGIRALGNKLSKHVVKKVKLKKS